MNCLKNNSKKCLYCNRKLHKFKTVEDRLHRKYHLLHRTCFKKIDEQLELNENFLEYMLEENSSNPELLEKIKIKTNKLLKILNEARNNRNE